MQPAITVPERLERTLSRWEGEAGSTWLSALPSLVEAHLERWGLTAERVCEPGGQISLVVYVRRADGTPAALKAGMVTPETAQEHAALAHWAGRGAARLLEAEPERAVLLLERLHGDITLRSLPEAKAMLEAAGILQRLWVAPPAGHPFRTVAEHVGGQREELRSRRGLSGAADAGALVDEALEVSAGLLADAREDHLLHGDFHHGNVLAAERFPWLAIDPKPLVGERAYDLAWLVQDRKDTLVGSPGPEAAVRRRLHRLAESLEVDRDRLRGWTLFRTVEAGLWSLSVGDRASAELFLEFAGRL
ncbi:aminoglycoside phosphotransferase family protein [Streptacidiphilus sp. ASG 303]|uniref:aminoglycoside phosphotransferase family protein n=1 Tax=Streptacidiphilus sp. ASG 303 TaxID=2896847 RepID=UPI001E34055F|nr:aminoglycoside phosphotransferase family protein [Streptacidiphilus sp. ASG 303]MCD0486439.1 aminoglycoside phosphotransferase family protein [Streptacidiphilus sp. ASG 303]